MYTNTNIYFYIYIYIYISVSVSAYVYVYLKVTSEKVPIESISKTNNTTEANNRKKRVLRNVCRVEKPMSWFSTRLMSLLSTHISKARR